MPRCNLCGFEMLPRVNSLERVRYDCPNSNCPPPSRSPAPERSEGPSLEIIPSAAVPPGSIFFLGAAGDAAQIKNLAPAEGEVERLRAEVRRYDLALQSLTPGGSEYVSDPERCVTYVRDTLESKHRVLVAAIRARKALDAEVQSLRRAFTNIRKRCFDDSEWGRYIDAVYRSLDGAGAGDKGVGP